MRLCPLCALASSWGVAQSLAFRGCLINNRGKQESWHVGLLVFLPHEVCPPQRLESSSLLGLRHPCPHGESMKQVLRRGGLPAGRQPHFYHLGSPSGSIFLSPKCPLLISPSMVQGGTCMCSDGRRLCKVISCRNSRARDGLGKGPRVRSRLVLQQPQASPSRVLGPGTVASPNLSCCFYKMVE